MTVEYNPYKPGTIVLTGVAAGIAVLYPEAIKNTAIAAYSRMAPIVAKALNPVCTYLTKVGTRGVTILSGLDYSIGHTFTPLAAVGLGCAISLLAHVIDARLASRPLKVTITYGDGSKHIREYASWFQRHKYVRLALSHALSGAVLGGTLALAAKVTGAAFGATLPGAVIALTAGALLIKGVSTFVLPVSLVGQPERHPTQPRKYDGRSMNEGTIGFNWLG